MRRADALDRALDGDVRRRPASAWTAPMVDIALEAAEALASLRLSATQRERIHARSLVILEAAGDATGRQRPAAHRPRRAVPGGMRGSVALGLGVAAVGWIVLHGRRTATHDAA